MVAFFGSIAFGLFSPIASLSSDTHPSSVHPRSVFVINLPDISRLLRTENAAFSTEKAKWAKWIATCRRKLQRQNFVTDDGNRRCNDTLAFRYVLISVPAPLA